MNKVLTILACIWLLLACFGWEMKGSSPVSFRPEDLFLIAMFVPIIIRNLLIADRFWSPGLLLIIIFVYLFLISISALAILLNMLFNVNMALMGTSGYSAGSEMFRELLRGLKYILVVYVFTSLRMNLTATVINMLVICCLGVIFIQVLQYMQVPGLNEAIGLIYGNGEEEFFIGYATDWAKELGSFRAGSVFGNPNVLGVFLTMPFILMLMISIRSLKDTSASVIKKLSLICVTCFLFMGIFLAQSRSSLISCFVGIVASFVSMKRYGLIRTSSIVTGLSGLIVLMALFVILFSGSTNRYTSKMVDGFGSDSMGTKKELTMDEVGGLKSWQVFVGKGPASSKHLDSELGHLLVWYGILGLVGYYLFYFLLYKEILNNISDGYIGSGMIGVLVAYLIVGIASSAFLNIRIFPVFLAVMSIAVTSQRYKTKVNGAEPVCA